MALISEIKQFRKERFIIVNDGISSIFGGEKDLMSWSEVKEPVWIKKLIFYSKDSKSVEGSKRIRSDEGNFKIGH